MKLFSLLGLLTACSTEIPQKLSEDSAVDGIDSEDTETEDTESTDTDSSDTDTDTDNGSSDDTDTDDTTDTDSTEESGKITFRKQTLLTLPGVS